MPAALPVGGLTFASIGLTAVVVGNAYYQKKQFYPSVVYITKSNPSLAAIYLLAFTFVILLGKLLKKVFFGQLRAAEFEQLLERSFYAVTETCLAFTVFRDDFSPKFVSLFTVLLFLKAFHYLTDSRVDFMERSPVITVLFHIRVTSLLLLLMLLDFVLLNYSYSSTITQGASVQLVFGFEYAILLTVGFNIAVKYICHSIDLRSENPWENKAVYLLYTELLVGFAKVVLYIIFLLIMIRIHTFPLFIIRPMYLTVRSFKNALNDVIQSRRAIHNMNTLYPDATPQELAAVDNVCIICREEMITGAKKLPCGHIFHSSCLRSWFQRQQTCPTCRMDILQQPIPIQQPQQQQQQPQQQQPQQPPTPAGTTLPPQDANQHPPGPEGRQNQNANPFRPLFPFPQFPINQIQQHIHQQFQQQLQQQQQQIHQFIQQQQQQRQDHSAVGAMASNSASASASTTASASTSSSSSSTANSTSASSTSASAATVVSTNATTTTTSTTTNTTTGFPFGSMPPFLPFMPFVIPPPPLPPNFEGLTLEELRNMEGNERSHVEARIRCLKNIHTLLDAAAVQLGQYNSVVGSLEPLLSTHSAVDPSAEGETKDGNKENGEAMHLNVDEASFTPLVNPKITSEGGVAAAAAADLAPDSPETEGPSTPDSDPDDPNEIRRRRIEKFTSSSRGDRDNLGPNASL